jgi:hypothetical protein
MHEHRDGHCQEHGHRRGPLECKTIPFGRARVIHRPRACGLNQLPRASLAKAAMYVYQHSMWAGAPRGGYDTHPRAAACAACEGDGHTVQSAKLNLWCCYFSPLPTYCRCRTRPTSRSWGILANTRTWEDMNTTLIIDPRDSRFSHYIQIQNSHVREASFSGNVIEQLQALVA